MIFNTSIKYSLSLCIAIAVTASCGSKKKLAENNNAATDTIAIEEQSIDFNKAAAYLQTHKNYTTFQGSAQANYKSAKDNHDIDINIKSTHKEATFFNVRAGALGLTMEVAAGLAKTDSITIVNRLDRTYYEMDYKTAAKLLHAPLDFKAIQNLFIGRPIIEDGNITQQVFEENMAIITMEKEGFIQTLYYNTESKLLEKLTLQNNAQQFECNIQYTDYKNFSNLYTFPYHQNISIHYQNNLINLDLKFKSIEFNNKVNYDLKIPRSYDKRNP